MYVTIVFFKQFFNTVHGKNNIIKLVKYHAVGNEPVFNAENHESLFTEICTKISVKFLVTYYQTATVYIYNDRQNFIVTVFWAEYIKSVCITSIIGIWYICIFTDIIGKSHFLVPFA